MTNEIEAKWTTKSGLLAVVVIHPAGHRCGYVAVSAENKNYGKNYDDINVDVHGGLTYSNNDKTYPTESNDLWWFGYDCAHLGDARDPNLMRDEYKEIYNKGILRNFFEGETIKTLEYCINECESLSTQLSNVKEQTND